MPQIIVSNRLTDAPSTQLPRKELTVRLNEETDPCQTQGTKPLSTGLQGSFSTPRQLLASCIHLNMY
jgi:hypothetical protein